MMVSKSERQAAVPNEAANVYVESIVMLVMAQCYGKLLIATE